MNRAIASVFLLLTASTSFGSEADLVDHDPHDRLPSPASWPIHVSGRDASGSPRWLFPADGPAHRPPRDSTCYSSSTPTPPAGPSPTAPPMRRSRRPHQPSAPWTADGIVHATGDGTATVTATVNGRTATATVTVTRTKEAAVPDFRNHIEPVLTRAGCNAGSCHGALAGKGGFKLSLRGFDPVDRSFRHHPASQPPAAWTAPTRQRAWCC